MQSLYCQATDCVHNMNGNCSAHTIQISNTQNETFCDTYAKTGSIAGGEDPELQYAQFTSKANAEFGPEFTGSPRIACNVSKCVFNKSFHCKARDVNIEEPHHNMLCHCRTYRPK